MSKNVDKLLKIADYFNHKSEDINTTAPNNSKKNTSWFPKRVTSDMKDVAKGFFDYIKSQTISFKVTSYVEKQILSTWSKEDCEKLERYGVVVKTFDLPSYEFPPMKHSLVPVTMLLEDGKHHLLYNPSDFQVVNRGKRYWQSVTIPSYLIEKPDTYQVTAVIAKDERVENAVKFISLVPGPSAVPEPDNIAKWQGLRQPPVSIEESEKFWLSPKDIESGKMEFDTEKYALIYDGEVYDGPISPSRYVIENIERNAETYDKIKEAVVREMRKLDSNKFEFVADEKSIISAENKVRRDLLDPNEPLTIEDLRSKPLHEAIGDLIRFTVYILKEDNYKEKLREVKSLCESLAAKLGGDVYFKKIDASILSPYGGPNVDNPQIPIEHAKFTTSQGVKFEIQIYPKSYSSYKEEMHKSYDEDKQRKLKGLPPKEKTTEFLAGTSRLTRRITQKPKAKLTEKMLKKHRDKIEAGHLVNRIVKMANEFLSKTIYAFNYKNTRAIKAKRHFNFSKLGESAEFVVLVKPEGMNHIDKVIDLITSHGGRILDSKKIKVDSRLISQHYKQFSDKSFFMPMVKYYTGRDIQVFKVQGTDETILNLRLAIGDAKPTNPDSFRFAITGNRWKDTLKEYGVLDNGIHISDSVQEGKREAEIWFGYPELYRLHDEDYHQMVVGIHRSIMDSMYKLQKQRDDVTSVQYSATNNETQVKDKPFDLDYRILTTGNVDEVADNFLKIHPDAVWDRVGKDESTGAKYIKLEVRFENGKADIAIVPSESYEKRIGSGHLTDIMPTEWKAEAGRRKSEAWSEAKIYLDKINVIKGQNQEVPDELMQKYKNAKKKYEKVKNKIRAEVLQHFGLPVPDHIKED